MTTEQLRHLYTIIDHYGVNHQMKKAIEECNELIEVVDNSLTDLPCDYTPSIIDEIADVEVMINQLKIIFDCFGEVEERIDFKINRQLERMKKEV